MANKYLLDSSAWIEYLSGTALGEEVKDIIENQQISTCILSVAEISDKFNKEKEKFDKSLSFIKNRSAVLDLTLSTCSEAGKLKSERRAVKKEFGLIDAITYLTAKANSCILVTKDGDFEGMENVIILGGKNMKAKNAPYSRL